MTPVLLSIALLFATAQETPIVRGRVCFSESRKVVNPRDCADTSGRKFAITVGDRERLFVWTSADSATVQVGVVAGKAETIDLDVPLSAVQLSIVAEPSSDWPADVKVSLAAKEQAWLWTLPPKSASRVRTLVVPRGSYTLALKAEHYHVLSRPLDARVEKVAVGELRLMHLPSARGIAVDSEGKGIASAIVTRPDASVCATANEQGAFACELGERVPPGLVVSAPGYGDRDIELPRDIKDDLDVGRVVLTKGHKLTVNVVRPEAGAGTVSLFGETPRYERSKLKTREIREREETVQFDVGSGTYYVLVAGTGALARLEVPVIIKDENVTETVIVEPYRVVGTVHFGDDPLTTGSVGLSSIKGRTWRGEIPVEAGRFEATLWQRGDLSAYVIGPELGGIPESAEPPTLGNDPTSWDIRLEKKMIVGRIFDAETRKPVAGVELGLTARQDNRTLYTSVKVDPDGSYRILSMRPGTYSLRVRSDEHAAFTTDVRVAPEDRIKTVDIALERGIVQPLEIVMASGAPARNATILEGIQPDRHNPQFILTADGQGRFALRGKAGESRLLYIVPRDGSFAVLRVQIPKISAEKPLRVVVPDPTSSLRVRATRDDQPVAAPLLIRFNGEFVPGAILRFVTHEFIGTRATGEVVLAKLPAGAYEVWGLAGEQDEEQMIASNGALRPPVRVGVSGGEQSVSVVAPPREVRRRP